MIVNIKLTLAAMLEVIEMKKILINKYYNFLMFLEDVFGGVETFINDHRKRIDDKYWCIYIAPQNNKSLELTPKNRRNSA
jgi:hypothetical protein